MPSESCATVFENTKEMKLGWLVRVQYQLQDKTRQGNLTQLLQVGFGVQTDKQTLESNKL